MDELHGKWEPVKVLGRGGQGVVYLARDTKQIDKKEIKLIMVKDLLDELTKHQTQESQLKLGQLVSRAITELAPQPIDPSTLGALKVLHQPENETGFAKAKDRMSHEVSALANVNHPNVLRILDKDLVNGWFVGEYHPDGPISDYPLRYKGNMVSALQAIRPIIETVALLHESKIVHRDIKPQNVFVATDGRLVLGDLGLVLFTDATHTRVTDTYENVGSRDWMPAWAMGMRLEEVRPSFDVFCLGKLLWAMLSGRTFLRLWYHHDDEFELEKLFPNDESIRWAKPILDKCIVEKEKECLQTTRELLALVDEVLPAIQRHAQIIGDGIIRRCQVCGLGTYKAADHSFDLNPRGARSIRIFTCTNCGHVQLFQFEGGTNSVPKAWR